MNNLVPTELCIVWISKRYTSLDIETDCVNICNTKQSLQNSNTFLSILELIVF